MAESKQDKILGRSRKVTPEVKDFSLKINILAAENNINPAHKYVQVMNFVNMNIYSVEKTLQIIIIEMGVCSKFNFGKCVNMSSSHLVNVIASYQPLF